jgi:hypothetical protein
VQSQLLSQEGAWVDEEEEEGVAKDAEQKNISLQKDRLLLLLKRESRESRSHDSKSRWAKTSLSKKDPLLLLKSHESQGVMTQKVPEQKTSLSLSSHLPII